MSRRRRCAHRCGLSGIETRPPRWPLRRALHRSGVDTGRLPSARHARRTIDVAFPKARVAVFVDGCFWHMCPEHATWPKNNAEWWRTKLQTNAARDRETTQMLERSGWQVVRLWEHEDVEAAVAKVSKAVNGCPA